MTQATEQTLIQILKDIHSAVSGEEKDFKARFPEHVFLPFKGPEIYLLHKAFIDAGGAPGEIYKSLLEKTCAHLANKTQQGFVAENVCKYSDRVTPEVKENVKRFLMRMIRNIDSYD